MSFGCGFTFSRHRSGGACCCCAGCHSTLIIFLLKQTYLKILKYYSNNIVQCVYYVYTRVVCRPLLMVWSGLLTGRSRNRITHHCSFI